MLTLATRLSLAIGTLLALHSCKNEPAAVPNDSQSAPATVQWDWSAFPQSDQLSLGRMRVDIRPKQALEIKGESSGILTLKVSKETTAVPKGFVWAQMNVSDIEELETRQRIEKRTQAIQNIRMDDIDMPEERKKALKELKDARRKVATLEAVLESPALREMSHELFSGDLKDVNEKTLKEARESLELAEKRLAFDDRFREELRDGEQTIQKIELSNKARKLDLQKKRSVYSAPFDGELRLMLDLVADQSDYTVAGREHIATLSDHTEIHAALPLRNTSWINLPPSTLTLTLKDRDRTQMPFHNDKILRDPRSRKDSRFYLFSVPLEGHESLKRLVGSQIDGELTAKLPERAWIVPKTKVSMYALGKTKTLDWEEMVATLWPGSQLIAEGLNELAITYTPPRP